MCPRSSSSPRRSWPASSRFGGGGSTGIARDRRRLARGSPGRRSRGDQVTTVHNGSGLPSVVFVGPRPDSPGGIAQFTSNLVLAVRDDAEAHVVAFRRLYPKWTRPGRLGPDASAVGAGIDSSPSLVPWRPWTWRIGLREIQ